MNRLINFSKAVWVALKKAFESPATEPLQVPIVVPPITDPRLDVISHRWLPSVKQFISTELMPELPLVQRSMVSLGLTFYGDIQAILVRDLVRKQIETQGTTDAKTLLGTLMQQKNIDLVLPEELMNRLVLYIEVLIELC